MLIWICCLIVPIEVEWLPPQGYVCLQNMVDKKMPTDNLRFAVHVGETQIICSVAYVLGV